MSAPDPNRPLPLTEHPDDGPEPSACDECHGRGAVHWTKLAPSLASAPDHDERGMVPCPACGGEGVEAAKSPAVGEGIEGIIVPRETLQQAARELRDMILLFRSALLLTRNVDIAREGAARAKEAEAVLARLEALQ
ncbi:MAG TPA: hypothetical protein VFA23_04365 [Dongiaceae bacterium]|nr:hypothetical protein [Dongiaceae bacterium]